MKFFIKTLLTFTVLYLGTLCSSGSLSPNLYVTKSEPSNCSKYCSFLLSLFTSSSKVNRNNIDGEKENSNGEENHIEEMGYCCQECKSEDDGNEIEMELDSQVRSNNDKYIDAPMKLEKEILEDASTAFSLSQSTKTFSKKSVNKNISKFKDPNKNDLKLVKQPRSKCIAPLGSLLAKRKRIKVGKETKQASKSSTSGTRSPSKNRDTKKMKKHESRKKQKTSIASCSSGPSQTSSSLSNSDSISSSPSVNSSTSSKEPCQTNPRRYCVLNSLTFPSSLHRITEYVFISATIGVDTKGNILVSGITEDCKSVLINPNSGVTYGPYKVMIFLKQYQALCIFQHNDAKDSKEKEKSTQKDKKKCQASNNNLKYYTYVQIVDIISRDNVRLCKLISENRKLLHDLDENQAKKIHFLDNRMFLYPLKKSRNTILQLEAKYQSIGANVHIAGNATKYICIRHCNRSKKLFVDNQNTGIDIPDTLLDAKDIHYKLNINGNVLLGITNQGHAVYVINLGTRLVYNPFITTRKDGRFVDVSFWYEEILLFLEQLSNGNILFLTLNYECSKKFKLVGKLENQPIFYQASFLHNLQNVNEAVFLGISTDTKELHTVISSVEADPHPLPNVLFSNIICPYYEEKAASIEIEIRNKEMPINGTLSFGYDSKGNVCVSTKTQIFSIDKTSEELESNPPLKLTKNKVFFEENLAVILGTGNRFLFCQASLVIDVYNEFNLTMYPYGEYDDDLLNLLQETTKNQIGFIEFEKDLLDIDVRIYPNGFFIVRYMDHIKPVIVEYGSDGVPRITHSDDEKVLIRVPSPGKVFHFTKVVKMVRISKNEMQEKACMQVTLNGRLLEGLSRDMPADYLMVEVNESGTIVIATIYNGYKDNLFVYDLESDHHWYVHNFLPDYIKSIGFLDDQNLFVSFRDKRNISGEYEIDHKKVWPSQSKHFLVLVSIKSVNAQVHNYKFLGTHADSISPFSDFKLIKKKHKGMILEGTSASYKPVDIENYYFEYQPSIRAYGNSPTFFGELRVTKYEHKLPIAL